MSDDGQNTTTDENQNLDQSAEQAANEALENSTAMPDLSDVEYATPSAYIDPDLPTYNPDTPVEEEPKEEEQPEEDTLEMTPEQIEEMIKASHAVMAKVAEKIANSRNILIATSSDPSVDELSSAITLARFLDRLGKHAIAIYSGEAPNALAFLDPNKYFENSADVLQDFVISVSKEKADHLRYKLDGEEVKVFITPYKSRITQEDLGFSYGDYNVDLVLALNVNNGVDLDPALREYGTIMHDATVINITTGNPGKFGEIEWNNKRASSVSEMIADLLCNASGDVKLEPEEATALLTGIVASTDRFAHANTFSTTMQIASQLIDFGASPEIVAENITDDVDNQFFTFSDLKPKKEGEEEGNGEDSDSPSFSFKPTEPVKSKVDPNDDTTLQISHGDDEETEVETEAPEISPEEDKKVEEEPENKPEEKEEKPEEPKEEEPKEAESKVEEPEEEDKSEEVKPEDPGLLDELKATEASLSGVGAETAPTPEPAPVQLDAPSLDNPAAVPISDIPTPTPSISTLETPTSAPTPEPAPISIGDFSSNRYSQMLEDALNEPTTDTNAPMDSALPPVNPAASSAPEVSATPEVSGMPEINYGQNSDPLLPPPPAPPVDINQAMPLPNMPAPEVPVAPETPAASAPDAFTIPGV